MVKIKERNEETETMNTIKINCKMKKGKIQPELHGQFIEFLGNCINDGIWVGEKSSIPNYNGLRKDVVDALKKLAPPVIRWPGGCYADAYHWRDGVGPRKERPKTYNENFGTYELETNQFGTHEFMELCKRVGAQPWININMLSGTVAEMKEWAEYCNRKDSTTLSCERESNGSKESFNVLYWGIGNECWGGGGNYTAEGYANEYRKYASAFPIFGKITPKGMEGLDLKLIACGPDGNKSKERVSWTKDFFRSLGDYRQPKIHAYDLHFYNWNVLNQNETESQFEKEDWYRVLNGAMELQDVILEQDQLIKEGVNSFPETEGIFQSPKASCDLIVGEWGNWHGCSFAARPALYQQCSMRDALTSAITLDIFHRNCAIVKMACVAQTVNVLNSLILTDGDKMVLTPNYHVFDMYKVHRGADAVECTVDTESVYSNGEIDVKNIYCFASIKDYIISINIVNACMDEEKDITINFDTDVLFSDAKVLAGECANSYNSMELPNEIVVVEGKTPEYHGGVWLFKVPAASVSVYRFIKHPTI